jgi:hypothetical protein
MSDPEKPLHVLVSEALGWTDCEGRETERWTSTVILNPSPNRGESVLWIGRQPLDPAEIQSHPMLPMRTGPHSGRVPIPRYDTDWSATGPLIEKYGIELTITGRPPKTHWVCWAAKREGFTPSAEGATGSQHPLRSVCYLLLELKAAGKLEA